MSDRFKFAFDPAKRGDATLELNGEDLIATHGMITNVAYETDGIQATLTLRLSLVAAEIDGVADVRLYPADRLLLEKLGWTPPAGGAS